MYLVRPPYLFKRLYPKAIWRKDPAQKKIFLTFDDGPVPIVTPWVLDLLKTENIKATFFCVGENIVKHPEIYQRILNEKHHVGNHTFNHLNGWNTDTKKYFQNIQKCADAMKENDPSHKSRSTDEVIKPLIRPPYGRIKNTQLSQLSKQYSVIMWDVLSGDYDKNTTPEKCLSNVIHHIRNGSIIVFHDSYKAQKNVEYALPEFIKYAKENGFEFDVL